METELQKFRCKVQQNIATNSRTLYPNDIMCNDVLVVENTITIRFMIIQPVLFDVVMSIQKYEKNHELLVYTIQEKIK